MEDSTANFLQDYLELLYSRALEAQQLCKTSNEDKAKTDFECGRALGYYEAVSLFISQVEVFELTHKLGEKTHIRADDLLN
jgi:hypothetical protein